MRLFLKPKLATIVIHCLYPIPKVPSIILQPSYVMNQSKESSRTSLKNKISEEINSINLGD